MPRQVSTIFLLRIARFPMMMKLRMNFMPMVRMSFILMVKMAFILMVRMVRVFFSSENDFYPDVPSVMNFDEDVETFVYE